MAYAAWSVVYGEQPTASKWNILGTNDASFNDGTGIANNAIKTAHITDANVTMPKIAAGAITNALLNTAAGELGGAWNILSPTVNNITLGTGGTKYSRWIQIGKTIIMVGKFTLGTGGSLSGTVSFNLPVAAASNNVDFIGSAYFNDAGTAYYGAIAKIIAGGSTVSFFNGGSSTSQPGGAVPFTWASGDNLQFVIAYEVA